MTATFFNVLCQDPDSIAQFNAQLNSNSFCFHVYAEKPLLIGENKAVAMKGLTLSLLHFACICILHPVDVTIIELVPS